MNIYVGQLPYNVNEDELREIFSEYGEIGKLNLIKDRFSGQSKGFGFIEMPNTSEADKAKSESGGTTQAEKFVSQKKVLTLR